MEVEDKELPFIIKMEKETKSEICECGHYEERHGIYGCLHCEKDCKKFKAQPSRSERKGCGKAWKQHTDYCSEHNLCPECNHSPQVKVKATGSATPCVEDKSSGVSKNTTEGNHSPQIKTSKQLTSEGTQYHSPQPSGLERDKTEDKPSVTDNRNSVLPRLANGSQKSEGTFNLSEKIAGYDPLTQLVVKGDVKTFIQKLKEELNKPNSDHMIHNKIVLDDIDKLAGKQLVEGGGE